MRRRLLPLLAFLTLSTTAHAAENRALSINMMNMDGPVDAAALSAVRQVLGHAVASGVLDRFVVHIPVTSSTPGLGMFYACATPADQVSRTGLNNLIQQLRSIHPRQGTSYTVGKMESCTTDAPVFCTMEMRACPDGSYVGRIPPSCEFAPCPGE